MSNRFNHIQPPNQFKYREGRTVLKQQYDFKCDNRIYFSEDIFRDLHNHSYRLYVDVLSPIGDYGLGLDFNEVDKLYEREIAPYIDGQLVNETLPEMNTTAENIAIWIWHQFNKHLPENNSLQKLEFFETDTQGLVLTTELMDK